MLHIEGVLKWLGGGVTAAARQAQYYAVGKCSVLRGGCIRPDWPGITELGSGLCCGEVGYILPIGASCEQPMNISVQ